MESVQNRLNTVVSSEWGEVRIKASNGVILTFYIGKTGGNKSTRVFDQERYDSELEFLQNIYREDGLRSAIEYSHKFVKDNLYYEVPNEKRSNYRVKGLKDNTFKWRLNRQEAADLIRNNPGQFFGISNSEFYKIEKKAIRVILTNILRKIRKTDK